MSVTNMYHEFINSLLFYLCNINFSPSHIERNLESSNRKGRWVKMLKE